ncbi:MAG: hypothetical protein V4703_09640, partial [Actinomycetota bacterium]
RELVAQPVSSRCARSTTRGSWSLSPFRAAGAGRSATGRHRPALRRGATISAETGGFPIWAWLLVVGAGVGTGVVVKRRRDAASAAIGED